MMKPNHIYIVFPEAAAVAVEAYLISNGDYLNKFIYVADLSTWSVCKKSNATTWGQKWVGVEMNMSQTTYGTWANVPNGFKNKLQNNYGGLVFSDFALYETWLYQHWTQSELDNAENIDSCTGLPI